MHSRRYSGEFITRMALYKPYKSCVMKKSFLTAFTVLTLSASSLWSEPYGGVNTTNYCDCIGIGVKQTGPTQPPSVNVSKQQDGFTLNKVRLLIIEFAAFWAFTSRPIVAR
jgi:hypothetical protein